MLPKLSGVSQKLHPGLRKIVFNAGWLFVERIFNMVLSFFVGIYLVRYLGPVFYGALSYSFSFVGLFGSIAKLGLDRIAIRNTIEDEKSTEKILGTTFFLKLIGSLLTFVLISFAIFSFSKDIQIRWLTIIIAIGLIFDSFDVIDFWFQSKVFSSPVSKIRSVQLIVSSATKFLFIVLKFPVLAFAWLLSIEVAVKAIGFIWVYHKHKQSVWRWQFSSNQAVKLLKDSWPLIFATVMIDIYMKIDQIMLGKMLGSEAVGTYAAAVRFSEVWYFLPMGICASVFPTIVRARQRSKEEYYERLQQLYDMMAWLSIIIVVPMSFVAQPLINNLLGSEYSESGKILTLHIWATPFVFQGVALLQWWMVENFTKFSFATTSLGALSNIVLNLYLIPLYGGIGAALATVISYAISTHFSCLLYPPMFKSGLMLFKGLLIPFRFRQNLIYLKHLKTTFF